MSVPYEADEGVLLRRNLLPFALVFPSFCTILGLFVTGAFGVHPDRWLPFVGPVAGLSLMSIPGLWWYNAWAHRERGALRVDAHGISLDGRTRVAADDIESAAFARRGATHPVVRLRVRGRFFALLLCVPDESAARAVLSALELDAAHARTSFALTWSPFQLIGVVGTFCQFLMLVALAAWGVGLACSRGDGVVSTGGGLVATLFGAAMVAAYWLLWRWSRLVVTIGTDGILMRRWGRARFVRWQEVACLVPWPLPSLQGVPGLSGGFDLVLRSGRRVPFATRGEQMRSGIHERDVVADRVTEGIAAARPREDGTLEKRLPSRALRPADEWLRDLRRAGSGAVDLRSAATDPEDLWRVVEDPEASTVDRAAAAAALSVNRETATQRRLRVAAAATAAPGLRVAIEAATQGDDARLAEVLDELDEEWRRTRGRPHAK